MRIGLDLSPAVHRRAGIGRYAGELARALQALASPHKFTAVYNRAAEAASEEVPTGWERIALSDRDKALRLKAVAAHLARHSQAALFPGLDLFHATDNLLPFLPGVRTVFTLHDLSFLTTDTASLPNRLYLRLMMGRALRSADAVIAVSDATRREAIRVYGLADAKVVTVHEGVGTRFAPPPPDTVAALRRRYHLPDRFILFVGTIEPRKNLAMLLDVFRELKGAGEKAGLVLVGRKGWRSEGFFAHLRACGLEREVILPGYVPDEDLPAFYGAADVFVFPSLCEGFGLPVLEAMACGVPVVAADGSSLPEIVGREAGILAGPRHPDAWLAALRRLLGDPVGARALGEAGRARAARFTWDRAARETMAVYDRVTGKAQS